jgi:preprotein translocase subunit SecG
MTLLIAFLTFVLIVNCLFLMLLILIQLPKKEAGAGIAFGGGATDALFGAGSGNALTKLTKYSASIFVGLAVLLSVMNAHQAREGTNRLQEELSKQASSHPAAPPVVPTTPNPSAMATPKAPATTVPKTALTSNLLITLPPNAATTPAAAPAKNAGTPTPAAPAK